MNRADLPPLIIFICACLFLLLAVCYPWLSHRFGLERAHTERRVLAGILGLNLMFIWSFWYINLGI